MSGVQKKRQFCNFTREEEILLINLVRLRPVLYNSSVQGYKDFHIRNSNWKQISETLNKPVAFCKLRWKSLRDFYHKKRKELSESGETETGALKWEYYDLMTFIDDVLTKANNKRSQGIQENNQEDNSEGADHQEESDDDPLMIEPVRQRVVKRPATNSKARMLNVKRNRSFKTFNTGVSSASDRHEHPTETIFKGLARTVMNFPPALAAEAKYKVCQIVSELEQSLYRNEGTVCSSQTPSVYLVSSANGGTPANETIIVTTKSEYE